MLLDQGFSRWVANTGLVSIVSIPFPEYFGRGVGFNTNHFNAQRNVSGQQPATLDIDDRANYSSTNHLSHRPISEQVPTGSSNTNTRTLGSSYRGAERNDRERSSVDGPKFEQGWLHKTHECVNLH